MYEYLMNHTSIAIENSNLLKKKAIVCIVSHPIIMKTYIPFTINGLIQSLS